jgi:hypothetical protein
MSGSRRMTMSDNSLTGYVKWNKAGTDAWLVNFKGERLPWGEGRVVQAFRHGETGDRSYAMVFEYTGVDRDLYNPVYATGYALGDGGDLFRGSADGETDFDGAAIAAKSESDYWGRLDMEQEQEEGEV